VSTKLVMVYPIMVLVEEADLLELAVVDTAAQKSVHVQYLQTGVNGATQVESARVKYYS
jgi:hypothetical protein